MGRFRRSVQHENFLFMSLVWPCKILDYLTKWKIEKCLKKVNDQNDSHKSGTWIFLHCISLHIERAWKSLIGWFCIVYYRIKRELNCDQEQELWMHKLIGFERWVKSLVIYVDKDGIWYMSIHEIDLWVNFDLSYMLYDVELIWLWKHDEWYEITVNMEMIRNCDDYWIDMELQWLWKVSNLYDGRCDLYIYIYVERYGRI